MIKLIVFKVQFSSVAQSCPTLCNPMDCSILVHHQLLELAQSHVYRVSDAIQPSWKFCNQAPLASKVKFPGNYYFYWMFIALIVHTTLYQLHCTVYQHVPKAHVILLQVIWVFSYLSCSYEVLVFQIRFPHICSYNVRPHIWHRVEKNWASGTQQISVD